MFQVSELRSFMPNDPFTRWLANKKDRLSKFKQFDVLGRGSLTHSELSSAVRSFMWLLPPQGTTNTVESSAQPDQGFSLELFGTNKKSTPLLNKARRLGSLQDQLSELEVCTTYPIAVTATHADCRT